MITIAGIIKYWDTEKLVRISYPVKINCAVTKARCSFRKGKKRSSSVMKELQIMK